MSKLLEMASETYSNHGCNDLPADFWEDFSKEDQVEFYKLWHEWNGDPEDFNPNQIGYLPDYLLMHFFADYIGNNKVASKDNPLAEDLVRTLKKMGVIEQNEHPSEQELIAAAESYCGTIVYDRA